MPDEPTSPNNPTPDPSPSPTDPSPTSPMTNDPMTNDEANIASHRQLTTAIQHLDSLNAQLGVAGALLVSHYQLQKQKESMPPPPPPYPYGTPPPYQQPGQYGQQYSAMQNQPQPYPGQPPYPPTQYGQQYSAMQNQPQPPYPGQPYSALQNPQPPTQNPLPANQNSQLAPPQGGPQTPPPLSQDLASLANILTQIQYDLFDISIHLAQPHDPENKFDTRIEDKAITWIKDLISKINTQLPANTDPILPVGNQLACEFYLAKTLSQQTQTSISLFYEQYPEFKPANSSLIIEYLSNLVNLMFVIFRWSNLVMGEKEWFWKPKDQMPQPNQNQQPSPNQQQPQPNSPLPTQPSDPSLAKS